MSELILDQTERLHGEPGGVRVLSVSLVVMDGPSRGVRVRVEGGKARVGTGEGNRPARRRMMARLGLRVDGEVEPDDDRDASTE